MPHSVPGTRRLRTASTGSNRTATVSDVSSTAVRWNSSSLRAANDWLRSRVMGVLRRCTSAVRSGSRPVNGLPTRSASTTCSDATVPFIVIRSVSMPGTVMVGGGALGVASTAASAAMNASTRSLTSTPPGPGENWAVPGTTSRWSTEKPPKAGKHAARSCCWRARSRNVPRVGRAMWTSTVMPPPPAWGDSQSLTLAHSSGNGLRPTACQAVTQSRQKSAFQVVVIMPWHLG